MAEKQVTITLGQRVAETLAYALGGSSANGVDHGQAVYNEGVDALCEALSEQEGVVEGEVPCDECNGTGHWSDWNGEEGGAGECGKCQGTGSLPAREVLEAERDSRPTFNQVAELLRGDEAVGIVLESLFPDNSNARASWSPQISSALTALFQYIKEQGK